MLELRNVPNDFCGIAAVDDVSFTARAGEVTGYLGPNGSGKSTTMKMITGLIEMTSGEILFDGEPIQRDLIAYKQRMGYVPEEPHLYAHLSGLEYLVMVGQLRDLPAKPTAERIDGLLRLLSLHGDRHAPISAYSKGMRQKVLLSAALLHNPDLLLLDEPFSGLDVEHGAGVAQPDPGTGGARQSGAVQLARTGDRGAGLLARRDSASRQDRGRRFHRAAADADGAADARRDLLAACRGAGYGGDFARDRGPDSGMRRETNSNSACCIASFCSAWWTWKCCRRMLRATSNKLLGQFAALLIFVSMLLSRAALGFDRCAHGSAGAPGLHLVIGALPDRDHDAGGGPVRRAELGFHVPGPARRSGAGSVAGARRARMFLAKVAAVATALSLTIVLLHGASGLIWPLAFAIQATPQTVPALTLDPTPAPVSADGMQSVLTRDLQQQLASGALAPGTGAGLAIGVWRQGEARIFAYGAARADPCSRSARSPRLSRR